MDIRKGKVERNREWSAATQKKLASMLGVSAMLSAAVLAACDLGSNTGDDAVVAPEGGIVAPEPTCGDNPCGDFESSSSQKQTPESSSSSQDIAPNLSSSVPQPPFSSSSSYYPPLAGVVAPETSVSSDVSSSSRHVNISYPMSSGMPMQYPNSSSSMRLSSSSLMPPTSGVSMSYEPVSSSSSYRIDSLQTTAGEVYVEPEPLAGIPELSSSSSEPEPLPGDPIELPEPLSGDVPPGDVIYIDDPKD